MNSIVPFRICWTLALTLVVGSSCALASNPAKISDEVVFSPHTQPVVKNDYSFTLVEMDGQPVVRENVEGKPSVHPDVIATEGKHTFRVSASRIVRATGEARSKPSEVEFRATIKAGSTYIVGGSSENPKNPILIEVVRPPGSDKK